MKMMRRWFMIYLWKYMQLNGSVSKYKCVLTLPRFISALDKKLGQSFFLLLLPWRKSQIDCPLRLISCSHTCHCACESFWLNVLIIATLAPFCCCCCCYYYYFSHWNHHSGEFWCAHVRKWWKHRWGREEKKLPFQTARKWGRKNMKSRIR